MLKHGLAGLLLALTAAPALAGSCPTLMHDIDRMLDDDAVVSALDASELERVRELREKGERLHENGDHGESVDVLDEALAILNEADSGGSSGGYSY